MSAVLDAPLAALRHPIVDAAFLAAPYPAYHALREAGPVHWSEEFFGGAWLLTRHADVEKVLRDARFSAQRTGGWVRNAEAVPGELSRFQQVFARAMLFVDAPDHTRLRKLMNAGFRPELLQRLAPFMEQAIDDLLDAVEGQSGFDFMQAVARPLPMRVMTRLMGIEAATHEAFAAWSDDLSAFIGAPAPTRELARRAQTSLLAMTRYFEEALPHKRRHPGDDLLSLLAQAEAAGRIEGGAELLAQCAMLLFAGHETTRNLLGNGLKALLDHPAQWQRLQREPALLPGAVRELLRYDSPVQYTGRRVATDLVLHGQLLRRGDLVVALIGAANRDPARHAHPDALDVAREDVGSLSFGSGPHACIGAALTRMEAQAVFGALLRRWPGLRAADGVAQWNGNPVYRGLNALNVQA
ncbi:cytochrome P450 [Variovorax sp. PBL-E5]|uniref:cytochrome P450 n=1 Tax=Variovorax sp. PBL-E5 TaxID=434014 RepID=UPI001319B33E|nr:cytochrome P450 [Variovorax sp. PBL-E5]VTU30363.1 Cytochrome P450 107B1 [Variovorax sp. PBL-E5]